MKIQDFVFIILFAFLLYKRRSEYFAAAGIVCLILAVPLFARWVFFTAERLTWYAAAFFLFSVLFSLCRTGQPESGQPAAGTPKKKT